MIKKILKNALYCLRLFVVAILLAIVLRVFFFSSFKIPTPSMEPAILAGDFIIVNKQIPGPRMIKNFFSLHKGEKPDITRFKGYRAIRRNDVLIFNFPYSNWGRLEMDMNVFYAKRCVALPGDTFLIENGIYKVKNCSNKLGNQELQYRFSQMEKENIQPEIFHCFPYDSIYNWNVKSFGPIYIPQRGDTLRMDTKNRLLYRNLIRYETESEEIPDELQFYVFQQNYYFMAGDYVFDSKDSRYWGLLPEDHIIGKVSFIWKSKDIHTGKYRWERFFKRVNN